MTFYARLWGRDQLWFRSAGRLGRPPRIAGHECTAISHSVRVGRLFTRRSISPPSDRRIRPLDLQFTVQIRSSVFLPKVFVSRDAISPIWTQVKLFGRFFRGQFWCQSIKNIGVSSYLNLKNFPEGDPPDPQVSSRTQVTTALGKSLRSCLSIMQYCSSNCKSVHNGRCAHCIMLSNFIGSHFGLPPSSIHKVTELGGKMVLTMTYGPPLAEWPAIFDSHNNILIKFL